MSRRLIALATTLLAGCAVGPDFQRPAAPQAAGYTAQPLPAQTATAPVPGGEVQRFAVGGDIPGQWWTLFHSEPLNALVERALKSNPNLKAARAALRVAQENAAAQRGAYYPQVAASLSPTRQKVADLLTSPLNSNASLFSLHTAQLSVGYSADIFGGNRRQVESLEAQAEAQRFELAAADVSLTANVVAAAIQEASLRGQIAATERVVALDAELLELMRKQFALGAIAESAVMAQEAALAQAQAMLPPLQKQLAQQRDLLIALAGGLPDQDTAGTFELASLQLPQELPVSLPAALVRQRPDVAAAEAQAHAASAQIGIAEAARLPQFSITADAGSVATTLGDLFRAGGGFWSVAGDISQPIFSGGTLLHRQRAAEAAYDQAMAQYRATVISACQNVADTLHALKFDAEALQAAATAERASARSLEVAKRQVELGDVSPLAALNAEQSYQQAQAALVQAQATRYADTAALFQALGGGWWNRSDAARSR